MKIPNILGNTTASLQKKSSSVMSVFHKTVVKLGKVNETIVKVNAEKIEKIQILKKESEELDAIHKENSKVINKITQFFN